MVVMQRADDKTSVGSTLSGLFQSSSQSEHEFTGDFNVRCVDVCLTDQGAYYVSSDGRLFSHGRSDFCTTGHRASRQRETHTQNPRQVELPAGLFVYRVFGSQGVVFLTTSDGLYGFGTSAPLGTTLFSLEAKLDARLDQRTQADRVLPYKLPYFKVHTCRNAIKL